MNRRNFIIGLGTIGLNGCQFSDSTNSLKLGLTTGSIPGKFIRNFSQSNKIKLVPKINKNYDELIRVFNKSSNSIDILGLGDAWLSSLPSPPRTIDPKRIPNWNLIPPQWRTVGVRDNRILAIPFRWGTTVIIYNQAKLKQQNIPPIASWQDLWHPRLKRKISLPDNAREVIGLCLKRRGLSFNSTDPFQTTQIQAKSSAGERGIRAKIMPNQFTQLKTDIDTLNQQVLNYTSTYYVQSLVNEDTWVAVGWSADVIEIVKRYPELKIIHPQEGTALWFDCWVIPKNSANIASAYQWFNYCLDPANSRLITLLTNGKGITDREESLSPAYLHRCEPILPLPPEIDRQYQKIWQDLRQKA